MNLWNPGMASKPKYSYPEYRAFLLLVLILFLCNSCNYFETQKIDSETFYKQDLEAISWDHVDQFPLFAACDEQATKEVQQQCFVGELSKGLHAYFKEQQLELALTIKDTVRMHMLVLQDGSLKIDSISITQKTLQLVPQLKTWLSQGMANITAPEPAIKRGIPVAVRFELPVVLATKD